MWDLNNEFLNLIMKILAIILIVGNSLILLTVLAIWIPTKIHMIIIEIKEKRDKKNGNSTR